MPNTLGDAVSPYLRSHAGNPVHWQQWGEEAFAEARRRQVPVFVSIGYSTCHWCHVMARESFSDPAIAAVLNENFVSVKVDREEHPDVDASYLAAASAFTPQLGWPLNVFLTPEGRAFFAGTYWPPRPLAGHPSFRQVLGAVQEAWTERRESVEESAAVVAEALAAQAHREPGALPDAAALAEAVALLAAQEDAEFGGFGDAPKFPVAPALGFLLDRAASGDAVATGLARRTLERMAASDLRDDVDGGFFRYSTQRDWTEPHYERMLYDNALLLRAYARAGDVAGSGGDSSGGGDRAVAEGIAGFLLDTLQLPSGGFASAQDSESTVDGERVEGGFYRLDAEARAAQPRPGLDEKVLTGWNGLAIEALAEAGFRSDRADWIAAARRAADMLLAQHTGTRLVRASVDGRLSSAPATLEDYGMFATGLLRLALATGEAHYAIAARDLVEECLAGQDAPVPFAVPGGADPVLAARGLAIEADPSEGAYPSGMSAMASASRLLHQLTAEPRYRSAAERAMALVAPLAVRQPLAFGAALGVMSALEAPITQLVVVGETDSSLAAVARGWEGGPAVVSVLTAEQAAGFSENGFELFEGRASSPDVATAYFCTDFVCLLPITDPAELSATLP